MVIFWTDMWNNDKKKKKLWSTEPPRSSPTCGLHLLHSVFSYFVTDPPTALDWPYYPLVECLLVDSMLRLWCFTFRLLPLRLHNKNHPVRAMETFIIIAAIIIILVLQRCLSGLRGPIASWMGTQRENDNQHPGFINLLVTGVQQKSSFPGERGRHKALQTYMQ